MNPRPTPPPPKLSAAALRITQDPTILDLAQQVARGREVAAADLTGVLRSAEVSLKAFDRLVQLIATGPGFIPQQAGSAAGSPQLQTSASPLQGQPRNAIHAHGAA